MGQAMGPDYHVVDSVSILDLQREFLSLSRGTKTDSKMFSQPRIVTTVAEFVSEVIPQSSNPTHIHEQIQWVRIQKCPLGKSFIQLL